MSAERFIIVIIDVFLYSDAVLSLVEQRTCTWHHIYGDLYIPYPDEYMQCTSLGVGG